MGLFKDLLSKGVKSLADDVLEGVLSSGKAAAGKGNLEKDSVSERIVRVADKYYPEYELSENIDAGVFYAETGARNYSFALSREGKICLTIMVLKDKNDYKRKSVILAHRASENAGVHCINIMEYLPSSENYINGRIAENIR